MVPSPLPSATSPPRPCCSTTPTSRPIGPRGRPRERRSARPPGAPTMPIFSGLDRTDYQDLLRDLAFYAIPREECHAILRQAYDRRATPAPPVPLQDLLRAVGLRADELGL